MPRIDQLPEYRANLPRTTHDLSHKLGFTATVAHLLPVYHDFLNPGETVELGFDYNLRTMPMQSAAMVDINSYTEYFFVPMQLLYEPFGSMFYDINDLYSSRFNEGGLDGANTINQLPVWDFEDYWTYITSVKDTVVGFESLGSQALRLLDLLGFNPLLFGPTENNFNPNVFPYQLLAYHCIYQYYYRLDTRERFSQRTFNWDRFYENDIVAGPAIPTGEYTSFVTNLFKIHYRPLASDYFTDLKVSPIVDVLNLNVKKNFEVAKQWLTRGEIGSSGNTVTPVLSSGSVGSQENFEGVASPFSPNYNNVDPGTKIQTQFGFMTVARQTSNFSVLNGSDIGTANIRAMFATEKLWSITGRAKKHYDDQTLAHFGFKVPHDVKHEITCFGKDSSKIHIGEVISTSASEMAPLGEIAGKGYGQQSNRRHKFTAPCHGVVMIIQSFAPELSYGCTCMKANVMTSKQDLYQSEYDHLGMQPLFGYEADPVDATHRNDIYGWQYRYEQWKRRYNRVTLAFAARDGYSEGSLHSWMLGIMPYYQTLVTDAPNTDSYLRFLYQPTLLNQIMLVNYVTTMPAEYTQIGSIYDGDPFVIDGYIHSKKVSTMSDYSLPRLDA